MGAKCCNADLSTLDTQNQREQTTEQLFFREFPKIEVVVNKIYQQGVPKNWQNINKTQQTYIKDQGIFLGKKGVKIRTGYGIMLYQCGLYYIGVWRDNNRHGFGYMIEKNGGYYKGEWRNDLPNGYGEYRDGNSSNSKHVWTYRGKWRNGQKQDSGEQVFKDGTKFIGNFSSNFRQGKGKFFFDKDCYFQGNFQKDIANCPVCIQKGIDYTYEGPFQNNDFHGSGKVEYHNSSGKRQEYIGQFVKGVKHGYGQYTWPDKSVYKGQWIRGQIANKGVYLPPPKSQSNKKD